jgi:hypothetical protein
MRIKLISQEEYLFLLDVQKRFPNLTYQNTGYNYPNKSKWSEEELDYFNQVSDILKESITGFAEFNHFKINKKGELKIRFQYDWSAADGGLPFTGVGYLFLDELLNGFRCQEKKELSL